jgi:hypothetical protein
MMTAIKKYGVNYGRERKIIKRSQNSFLKMPGVMSYKMMGERGRGFSGAFGRTEKDASKRAILAILAILQRKGLTKVAWFHRDYIPAPTK